MITAAAAEHVGHGQRLSLLTHELLRRLVVLPVVARELQRLVAPPVVVRELRRLVGPPVAARELRRLVGPPVAARVLRPLVVLPVAARVLRPLVGLPVVARVLRPLVGLPVAARVMRRLVGLPVVVRELRRLVVPFAVVVGEPLGRLLGARLPLLAAADELPLRLAPVAHVVDQAVAEAAQLERSRTAARFSVAPEQDAWDLAGVKQSLVAPAVLPAARAVRLERRALVAGMQLAECRPQKVAAFLPIDPVPVHPVVPESAGLFRSHSEARPGPPQLSAEALRVWSMAAYVVADLHAQPHRLDAEVYPSRTGTLIAAALVEAKIVA
jgi:hypothetical protein